MNEPHIYLLSDLHLGDGTAADRFLYSAELFTLLEQVAADPLAELVLVGDVMELWACSLDAVAATHYRHITMLLNLAQSRPVTYVVGNHDALPGYLYLGTRLGGLQVTEQYRRKIGGDLLVAIHGHQYDPFNKVRAGAEGVREPWARHLVAMVGALERLGVPIMSEAQTRVDQLLAMAGQLDSGGISGVPGPLQEAVHLLRRLLLHESPSERNYPLGETRYREAAAELMRHGARWVVMGHTHHPDRMTPGRKTYVNTGSWCWDRYPPTYALFAERTLTLMNAATGAPFVSDRRTPGSLT